MLGTTVRIPALLRCHSFSRIAIRYGTRLGERPRSAASKNSLLTTLTQPSSAPVQYSQQKHIQTTKCTMPSTRASTRIQNSGGSNVSNATNGLTVAADSTGKTTQNARTSFQKSARRAVRGPEAEDGPIQSNAPAKRARRNAAAARPAASVDLEDSTQQQQQRGQHAQKSAKDFKNVQAHSVADTSAVSGATGVFVAATTLSAPPAADARAKSLQSAADDALAHPPAAAAAAKRGPITGGDPDLSTSASIASAGTRITTMPSASAGAGALRLTKQEPEAAVHSSQSATVLPLYASSTLPDALELSKENQQQQQQISSGSGKEAEQEQGWHMEQETERNQGQKQQQKRIQEQQQHQQQQQQQQSLDRHVLLELGDLVQGVVVKRPSATVKTPYVADVLLDDGQQVLAHTPAMDCAGMIVPGCRVYMTQNAPKAKGEPTKTSHTIQVSLVWMVPPRCSLSQLEMRGLWHFLLRHIMSVICMDGALHYVYGCRCRMVNRGGGDFGVPIQSPKLIAVSS